MAYGIEVFDEAGTLTSSTVVTSRFLESVDIPDGSTSSFTVALTGVEYNNDVFVYFEPRADTVHDYQDPNSAAPTFSVSGVTVTIQARGTGGTCFVGVT